MIPRLIRILVTFAWVWTAGVGAAAAVPLGCLIMPEQQADIGTPVVGVVESVLVDRGDHVSKDQVLAVLQSRVEQASLEVAQRRARVAAELRSAEAGLELARSQFVRSQDLYDKQFISSQALDQARAELKVAEQQVDQSREQLQVFGSEARLARAQLHQRVLKAPFDGVVVDRMAQPGERVEDRPLLRLAAIDRLRVEVVVPAVRFGSIRAGMAATVLPDLPGMQAVHASVQLVDPIVDPASNTFRVRLAVDNRNGAVPAGARCRVAFDEPPTVDRGSVGELGSVRRAGLNVDLKLTGLPARR
ncbi:MAG: efflux RND transporter periplasmic adaptor subunit [Zoogloeaceae bacterium]|nr:efflux RND transporter periplasmic adaptor subunit [Rhodocyclaceae bacterium]MCP5236331.1 efflux RND transporter periplasmic adaptor subunit [Zoogloeaceae bacterium]